MGSRRPSAATTTRRKQRERTTPLFERRASTSRSTFRTISLLHLASTCRRRSELRSSRFRGVSWDKRGQKWVAKLKIDGKSKFIGGYDDETEAARACDATVRAQSLDKPLNFPDDLSTAPGVYVPKRKRVASSRFRGATNGEEESDVGVGSEAGVEMLSSDEGEEGDGSVASASRVRPSPYASYALPDFTAGSYYAASGASDSLSVATGFVVPQASRATSRVASSRFRGVSWVKREQKWTAQVTIDGKTKHIGSYDDETEAARAYDATVRAQSLDKPLNFPDDLSTAPGVYVPKKKKRVASSRFRGVSWDKTNQKWTATIKIDGKSKTIGSYDDETEAARAYDATVRAQSLDKPLNFPDDLSTAPGVYVPKKEASRIVEVSWGELGQDESEVGGDDQLSMGSRRPSAATTTRRKQRERTTPLFERRASISRSTFRTISLLHLASTCRRRRSEFASSRFRGVSWNKTNQKWTARSLSLGRRRHRQLRRRDGSSASVRRHCSSAEPRSAAQLPGRSLYCT